MNRVAPWLRLAVILPLFLLASASCGRRDDSAMTTSDFLLDPVPASVHIRVALFDTTTGVNLDIDGSYEVFAGYSARSLGQAGGLRAATVRASASGISIGAANYPIAALRLKSLTGAPFAVNGKPYRGDIHVERLPDQTIRVINFVSLEAYLYGVIGAEVPLSWHPEALKTQAVAARSWATKRILIKRDAPFDVYDDTRSQMYKGIGAETDAARAVVDATRGEVLAFKGQLLTTYFHSYCGGQTEDALRVFGERHPGPLGGVYCPYCKQTRVGDEFTWRRTVSQTELQSALRGLADIKKIESMRIDNPRGVHADALIVYHDGDVSKLDAVELRKRLGLRSTAWTQARLSGGGIEFTGVGFGHGVGMCQWGAQGMALRNARYQDILKFYYPGSELRRLP